MVSTEGAESTFFSAADESIGEGVSTVLLASAVSLNCVRISSMDSSNGLELSSLSF